jgi:hypothetical protein
MAGSVFNVPPNWERYQYNDAFLAYGSPQMAAELCTRFMNSLGLTVTRAHAGGGGTVSHKTTTKRTISAAGRKKIAAAQKQRWAKRKAAGTSGI